MGRQPDFLFYGKLPFSARRIIRELTSYLYRKLFTIPEGV